MTAYRDTTEAKRSLLESLAAELRSIEAHVFIPDALDAAYDSPSAANTAWCEQRDRVMQADGDRTSLDESALDEAIEIAEAVVAQWRLLSKDAGGLEQAMMTPADEAPYPIGLDRTFKGALGLADSGAALVMEEALALPLLVRQRLTSLRCVDVRSWWVAEPDALVSPWVFHLTARREDTPFAFRCQLGHRMGALFSSTTATTSIPRARKPLLILARGAWWRRIVADRRMLGAETPTGDVEIDETFAARGVEAPQLVKAGLALHLRTLLRCEAPEVGARAGTGAVSWLYDPEDAVLKATLAILDHLRNAPLRFSLRREPSSDDT